MSLDNADAVIDGLAPSTGSVSKINWNRVRAGFLSFRILVHPPAGVAVRTGRVQPQHPTCYQAPRPVSKTLSVTVTCKWVGITLLEASELTNRQKSQGVSMDLGNVVETLRGVEYTLKRVGKFRRKITQAYEHHKLDMANDKRDPSLLSRETNCALKKLRPLQERLGFFGLMEWRCDNPACERCASFNGTEKRRGKSMGPRIEGQRFYDDPLLIKKVRRGTARH